MTFRLTTLFWLFALFGAAMGTFGPGWGIFLSLVIGGVHRVQRRADATIGCLVAVAVLVGVVLMLTPAVQSARLAAQQSASLGHLGQITLGVHNYHDFHRKFPPPATTNDEGEPLHSWRTQLLPFIYDDQLYRKLALDEPWDSAANSAAFDGSQGFVEDLFQSYRQAARGAEDDETHYLAIVDEATVWSPAEATTFRDITDRTFNTIVVIEVGGMAIKWYEPRDLTMEEAIDVLTGEFGDREYVEPGFFVSTRLRGDGLWPRGVAFADGHVRSLYPIADREVARALLTRAGGEEVSEDDFDDWDPERAVAGYIVHWGRVWGLALFIALSVAPVWWKRRAGDRRQASEASVDAPPSGRPSA